MKKLLKDKTFRASRARAFSSGVILPHPWPRKLNTNVAASSLLVRVFIPPHYTKWIPSHVSQQRGQRADSADGATACRGVLHSKPPRDGKAKPLLGHRREGSQGTSAAMSTTPGARSFLAKRKGPSKRPEMLLTTRLGLKTEKGLRLKPRNCGVQAADLHLLCLHHSWYVRSNIAILGHQLR